MEFFKFLREDKWLTIIDQGPGGTMNTFIPKHVLDDPKFKKHMEDRWTDEELAEIGDLAIFGTTANDPKVAQSQENSETATSPEGEK